MILLATRCFFFFFFAKTELVCAHDDTYSKTFTNFNIYNLRDIQVNRSVSCTLVYGSVKSTLSMYVFGKPIALSTAVLYCILWRLSMTELTCWKLIKRQGNVSMCCTIVEPCTSNISDYFHDLGWLQKRILLLNSVWINLVLAACQWQAIALVKLNC